MTSRTETYRRELRASASWDDYLLENSCLPGPRANLELAQAAADEGDKARFHRWLELGPDRAPTNTPYEFLPVCGAIGLGRLIAEGRSDLWPILRRSAADPRWRMREAVAMALQRVGDRDMDRLLAEVEVWSRGSRLEQRAAAAGVCEPRLLSDPRIAQSVLGLLDGITASMLGAADRRSEEFKVLRQAMGYCWSVAVAALPAEGRTAMERWLSAADPDVTWIMRENLKKNRLVKMDAAWVERWAAVLRG